MRLVAVCNLDEGLAVHVRSVQETLLEQTVQVNRNGESVGSSCPSGRKQNGAIVWPSTGSAAAFSLAQRTWLR